jgi:putative transposase
MTILKAYKYRLYPTQQQHVLLNKMFGCVRVVWNHHVEVFNQFDKNQSEPKQPLTTRQLKQQHSWLNEVSAAELQQKEMDFKMFKKNYFAKSRKKKLGRPAFKTRDARQSYRLPNQKFTLNDDNIRLEKIGKVKLVLDRAVPDGCKFMSVTISKNKAGQFFASVLVECEVIAKPKTGKHIGLDIGLKTFLTGSDSVFTVPALKFFRENQAELKTAQRHLARKQKGSRGRVKAKHKVARLHNKIANQRNTFIQQITAKLVTEYDVIAIEDLNVAGMLKHRKLAKSISDASFTQFYNVLSYKAEWYGKKVVKVDRWFASSKTCSCCGWKNDNLTLSDRVFCCSSCGLEKDRDLNAAENILQQALRVSSALRTQSECQTETA